MTNSRKNRGMANGHGAKWDNAPLWDSIEKKQANDKCKHNRITFGAVKTCKDCGQVL